MVHQVDGLFVESLEALQLVAERGFGLVRHSGGAQRMLQVLVRVSLNLIGGSARRRSGA